MRGTGARALYQRPWVWVGDEKQLAMQLLSGLRRRGRECGCDGSGKEGKAEKEEKEVLKQMTGN